MARPWIITLCLALLCGCDANTGRMEHPEDSQGPCRDQIAAARHVLEQNENWADRAKWEVMETDEGWRVIAWRVERPDHKGSERYLPWGYSEIDLDRRLNPIHYRPNK